MTVTAMLYLYLKSPLAPLALLTLFSGLVLGIVFLAGVLRVLRKGKEGD